MTDHFADASKKVLKGGQGRTTDDIASDAGFLVILAVVAVALLAAWAMGAA